jgi:ubiquinone/menaquinone biosynthesis C-methylase UbiE
MPDHGKPSELDNDIGGTKCTARRVRDRPAPGAAWYDLLAWLFTHGREGAFRENVVRLARLDAGERVLDVGCGTGTLAIAAKRPVGPTGRCMGSTRRQK